MTGSRDDGFSDGELLRSIAARLHHGSTRPGLQGELRLRYGRFDLSRARGARSALVGVGEPPRTFGAELWNQLLDACLSLADGKSAFLIDAQGLCVAARGELSAAEAEAVGSRLLVALDQARHIGPMSDRAEIVAVQTGTGWLTGLRDGGPARLLVGVMTREPLDETARDAVEDLLRAATVA